MRTHGKSSTRCAREFGHRFPQSAQRPAFTRGRAARAELAAELLASLDGPADPDAESAWDAEIDRRIEAIEAGTIRLEPWEQGKRRIEKDLLGR
jgi:putative addiction module component